LFESLGKAIVPNSCDIVVLRGRLDHAKLRAAIHATLQRHPILRASDGPIDLRFHFLDFDEPDAVDAHLMRHVWDEPFARDARPVRFHVTETKSATYLQTIHTHVYADATACYTLTAQIAEAYAGARAHDATRAHADEIVLPRAPAKERARATAQTAHDLAAKHAGVAAPKRASAGPRKLARFVLTPAETSALRAAARQRGHSIHAFFQLAFLRAASAYNERRGVGHPLLRLWDFFSLRPMLEETTPRYDCLALVYPVELDARWSDDEVLAHVTDVVAQMRKEDLLMHAHRIGAVVRSFGSRPRRAFMKLWTALFKSNVFFTNPGVCPSRLERFGDVEVTDYVTFPQLFSPADVMFVFSTFRDALRVLVIYDEDAFGASFRELFDAFLRNVGALASLDLAPDGSHEGFVARWSSSPRSGHDALATPMKQSA
jgi:hypothetical protein